MKKRKIVLLLVVVMATSAWAQTVVQESLAKGAVIETVGRKRNLLQSKLS
jgi:hypothetical protein